VLAGNAGESRGDAPRRLLTALVPTRLAAVLEFDRWKVGQTSERQTATAYNSGHASIDVTGIAVVGDFLVQDVVPQYMSIPPNGFKYFWVWFRPTTAGPQQGSITLQTNDPRALPALQLTGIGLP
jgi:hypothetical protein